MVANTILSGNPSGCDESSQDMAVKIGNPLITNTPTPFSYAAAAAITLVANDIITGLGVVGGNGASACTVNLPSATSLVAALRQFSSRGIIVGDTVWCLIINGSSGAGTVTIAAGTGGSFDANHNAAAQVIPQNSSKEVAIRFTSTTTYTVYS